MIKEELAKLVTKKVLKSIVEEVTKNHGSKVKKGAFEDCKVTLIGTKACIDL